MTAVVCNCSRAVWKYMWHLDSCDINDNSDYSDSSDSRQEWTCLQDFATVCIINGHNLGFGGLWVCAVSVFFVCKIFHFILKIKAKSKKQLKYYEINCLYRW